MKRDRAAAEAAVHGVFLAAGLVSVGCVLLITGYLIVSGIPALRRIGLAGFLFGREWASTAVETCFRVCVPAAKSGIAAAAVLGTGRAAGEAMAVMMVCGCAPNMPDSLFQSVHFLTTVISSEMAYSDGLQREALFSIALVLFLFIMALNSALGLLLKGRKER